jgi:hypothetical protein
MDELLGADTCLSDPPFGISHPCNFAARGRGNLAPCSNWQDVAEDNEPFDPSRWLGFERVILWGGNYFADKLPPVSGWLVWDKERPDDLDQATCEMAWTNCVKGVRRFRHLWNGMMRASEHGENYHPTQKPVALMNWALSLPWVKAAKVVCDPYMGSGPVALACIRTGRQFIGIEKDPVHFQTAVDRIRRELSQPMLLPPVAPKHEQTTLLA